MLNIDTPIRTVENEEVSFGKLYDLHEFLCSLPKELQQMALIILEESDNKMSCVEIHHPSEKDPRHFLRIWSEINRERNQIKRRLDGLYLPNVEWFKERNKHFYTSLLTEENRKTLLLSREG